ncbi:MAG TPA: hypothetical protein VF818_01460 [Ktedonobacterales bacterium]
MPNPHPGGNGGPPTVTPPSDLTPHPLPAFSDWRVAYIGMDGRLHAVSLGGRNDNAGSALPFTGEPGLGVFVPGTSPDGKHLAYFSNLQLTLVNIVSGGVRSSPISQSEDWNVYWSPDQSYLALRGLGAVVCVRVADASSFSVPQTSASTAKLLVREPFGWLNATHVAVTYLPGNSASQTTFQSLDVTTGALRPIATIPVNSDESAFAVEPGGLFTLFWDRQYQSAPFTPVVDLINNATGQMTPLPNLTSILSGVGGFTQVLWRPGYSQALVATGFPQNNDLKYYLIDVASDTATPFHLPAFPEAWSPDGGTLVVATGGQASDANGLGYQDIGVVGSGPYTLSAIVVNARGGLSAPVSLTTRAMDVPVLGFVRTS